MRDSWGKLFWEVNSPRRGRVQKNTPFSWDLKHNVKGGRDREGRVFPTKGTVCAEPILGRCCLECLRSSQKARGAAAGSGRASGQGEGWLPPGSKCFCSSFFSMCMLKPHSPKTSLITFEVVFPRLCLWRRKLQKITRSPPPDLWSRNFCCLWIFQPKVVCWENMNALAYTKPQRPSWDLTFV